jgi:hypothetical protein
MVAAAMAIRPLEPEDIRATAALLAKAMDDDPAYNFLFPRGQDRSAGLEDFFARNLRTHLPYRCTYVGVVGPTVVATITMRPPEGISISLRTMLRRGLLPYAARGTDDAQEAQRRLLRAGRIRDRRRQRCVTDGPSAIRRLEYAEAIAVVGLRLAVRWRGDALYKLICAAVVG